jgi:hypothetical protein
LRQIGVGVVAERHVGLAPDRTERSHARLAERQCAIRFRQRPPACSPKLGSRVARTARRAELFDHDNGFVERSRVSDVQAQSRRLQLAPVLDAVLFLVDDDEVGPELDDASHIRILGAADRFDAGNDVGRLLAVAGAADEAFGQPQLDQCFGKAGNERDDSHSDGVSARC